MHLSYTSLLRPGTRLTSSPFHFTFFKHPFPFPLVMPCKCPVCSEICSDGNSIKCTACNGWVHHDNNSNCSRLTDSEYQAHIADKKKPWKCERCVMDDENIHNFLYYLPYPVRDTPFDDKPETTIFNSPTLKHKEFLARCSDLEYELNIEEDHNDRFLSRITRNIMI